MKKLKVMTVVGTRPEIIRLSELIKKLDRLDFVDHILVHTGQNYDYELNQIFFEDLNLREPNYYLNAAGETSSITIGNILIKVDSIIRMEQPNWFVVLGDTNSALSAISARKNKVPILHLEAGNRSFDEQVPEEINRRLLDHIADINMPYSELSRKHLLLEGIKPHKVFLSGSPLREVITSNQLTIENSFILDELKLKSNRYILMSFHRDENVENPSRLKMILNSISEIKLKYNIPIVISTHPRSAKRIKELNIGDLKDVLFHKPFKFSDYMNLQLNAFVVISDSGSISEESSICGFPAVNFRFSHERPEAFEVGSIPLSGLFSEDLIRCIELIKDSHSQSAAVDDYSSTNFSQRVINVLVSNLLAKEMSL